MAKNNSTSKPRKTAALAQKNSRVSGCYSVTRETIVSRWLREPECAVKGKPIH